MPFKIVGSYVINANTGQRKNKKPMSKERLRRYLRALYANVPEARTKETSYKFFRGHKGRPGKVGGSLPRTAGGVLRSPLVLGLRPGSLKASTSAIDSVHSVEGIAPVKFIESAKFTGTKGAAGGYNAKRRYIIVNSKGNYKALTAVHEFGHVLDGEAFNTPALRAKVKAVHTAMEGTAGVKMLRRGKITKTFDFGGKKYVVGGNIFGYYLRRDEMFARGYAQYIATRSKSRAMKVDLNKRRHMVLNGQWSDKDFVKVANAYDDLFKEAGWLK